MERITRVHLHALIRLAYIAVNYLHELIVYLRLIATLDGLRRTVFQIVSQHDFAGSAQALLSGCNLRQNVHAVATFFDHLLNAPKLSFDPSQPPKRIFPIAVGQSLDMGCHGQNLPYPGWVYQDHQNLPQRDNKWQALVALTIVFRSFLVLGFIFLLLAVPTIDQLACAFCGPSPQSTRTAKAVPHTEDDCALKDGFEQKAASPDGEPTHIHFCMLHATSVMTDDPAALPFQLSVIDIAAVFDHYQSIPPSSLYHPPVLS